MFYAQIDTNGICFAVSDLTDIEDSPNMILIDSIDLDKLWRKYENGVWSTEKFEPATVPYVDPIAELKAENASLREQMAQANSNFTEFTDFYFTKFPDQA